MLPGERSGPIDIPEHPLDEQVEAVDPHLDEVRERFPFAGASRLDGVAVDRLHPSLAPSGALSEHDGGRLSRSFKNRELELDPTVAGAATGPRR